MNESDGHKTLEARRGAEGGASALTQMLGMEVKMERKPLGPFVAVKAEMIDGVPYVEARYLQECVAEIARLKDELADATDYHKTQYLTASEREKLQAVLNASLRQVLDAMPNVELTGASQLAGEASSDRRERG